MTSRHLMEIFGTEIMKWKIQADNRLPPIPI